MKTFAKRDAKNWKLTFLDSVGNNLIHSLRENFQVKSSNNDDYRVKPVYGFVPKQDKTEWTVIRLSGPPKEDKFVIQWAEVPEEESEPEAPFKAGSQAGEIILPVNAE